MFADEFAAAEITCIFENFFTGGEWAILQQKDPNRLCGYGFFQIQMIKLFFSMAIGTNCLFSGLIIFLFHNNDQPVAALPGRTDRDWAQDVHFIG